MKKNLVRTLFIICAVGALTTSCIRDKFKYYGYEDQLEGYAPVDYVDPSQTWILTKECSNGVGGIPNNAERVVLLSGNPFTDDGVEILAEVYTSVLAGQYANLSFVAPPTINKVYAAALGENGEYLAFAESALNATVKFDGTVPTGNPKAITPQKIEYCFEAEYPKPGDWDYNDVVMTISKEIVRDLPNVVALNVSLDAVGYLEQIAAAIRLVGYPNNKVTITQNESSTFVREPARERKILTQKELQFASLNGDAVINLFDDAHLAMYHSDKDGNVYRRYFNTIENPSSDNKGAVQPAVKVTFYLDFDDENMARNFQLTELDPFILVQYGTSGSNFWEIHTYPYKLHEVVYHYYNDAAQSYNNLYTWAIPIPDGDFRYPLEGEPMGMMKNSIVSGAYQTIGHSFGEWVMDATSARDWYEYPADGAVYFKYYGYEDELEGYAPVDYVDPSQTWILTKECSNGVGGIPNNAERVVLLSGNPFTDDGVEILAEVYTSVLAGQYANLSFVAPPTINKVYAAALGENGEYLAFAESALNATIKFDGTVPTGNPKSITPQEIKYCFEAEYPKPGDWDYNDVVMTISKEIVRDLPNVVALNVSLDAVGYLEQIAAAIRLVGYPNNKVTITQNESTTFVREPERERKILTQKELQFASLNGHAVINLFDDAHLAMYHSDKDGNVYRRYFNTIENPTSDNKGAVQPAVKVTFYLDFDDENMARNFQLTELDPFILVQYGTAGDNFWEIHTYPYKLHEVVYHYYNGAAQSYDNLYTWAIPIPDGDFRYPLEGEPMGMLKNSIVSGSYQTIGHSFGEWVMDATSARDWYEYPADGAVY